MGSGFRTQYSVESNCFHMNGTNTCSCFSLESCVSQNDSAIFTYLIHAMDNQGLV
jgi:hypothetical protein